MILPGVVAVLILKNTSVEGPGTIEDHLNEAGMPYSVVDLEKEGLPGTKGFDTLVMMGGPMSVNEESQYRYISDEITLVKEFVAAGRKVFGVCLGAQIMAKALGARVYAGSEKEIGWYDITLTEEGSIDPLMKRLATHSRTEDLRRSFPVFHWHGETFDIPEGAVRLAGSALYPNQAFRYGDNAYAFQFHIEVRKAMIYEWLKNEPVDMVQIRAKTEAAYDDYLGGALSFYKAFLK